MTPPRIAYPSDVAAEFIRREEATWHRLKMHPIFGKSFKNEPKSPTKVKIKQLIETMFFASQATEEGHFSRVGIVFIDDLDSFRNSRWTLVRFCSPLDFDVNHITKYASACGATDALFAVVADNQQLKIVGIATPPAPSFLAFIEFIQVIALNPGDVSVRRGVEEIVRYRRGRVLQNWPSVDDPTELTKHHIKQLNTIQRAVIGNDAEPAYASSVFSELAFILKGMVRRKHGGLIVVLGPDDNLRGIFDSPMRLAEPLKFGEALRNMNEALSFQRAVSERNFNVLTKTFDYHAAEGYNQPNWQERADEDVQFAASVVSRMVEQITNFTTVDGAVVLNQQLDVLAFGVKLPSQDMDGVEVKTIGLDRRPDKPFLLSMRGTRHRAAAGFAKAHDQGLSVIVSQDGDAAIFVAYGPELVVHWPLAL
ncbi:DNA integrity scanning protein DisA nucleotide-binding domain protein [Cystobacter fuscus]|uniref:DNA integrity scanning protein DisA nucleotide-binding domain protein n=1 Tax=Cystobacter fuscus TaxID=43 RepID=UPI0009DC9AD0|nr:DNA integrity scanning protein DisA nucleotide-binding domain protein [Cystobacter fuscus]